MTEPHKYTEYIIITVVMAFGSLRMKLDPSFDSVMPDDPEDANPVNTGTIGLLESVKSMSMAAPLLLQSVAKSFICHRLTRIT